MKRCSSILFIVGILGPALALATPLKSCQDDSSAPADGSVPLNAFNRAVVQSVHLDLKKSVLLTDRNLACLRRDGLWFSGRGILWDERRQDECRRRVQSLMTTINHNLPEMRLNLALAGPSVGGDAYDVGVTPPEDPRVAEAWISHTPFYFDHFFTRKIAHQFRGLAELDALTSDEMRLAMVRLREDAEAFKVTTPVEQKSFFRKKRAAYRENYRSILAANPILGFLPHYDASEEDVRIALQFILKRAQESLAKFELKFYRDDAIFAAALTESNINQLAVYRGSIERLVRADASVCAHANGLMERAESSEFYSSVGLIAAAIGATVACQIVKSRVPGSNWMRFCAPAIGLALSVEGIVNSEIQYERALEGVLQGPYGWTALNEIDQLGTARGNLALAWLLSPFGTGLPLGKWLSPSFLRELNRFAR